MTAVHQHARENVMQKPCILHVVRSFDLSGRSRMIHDLCVRLSDRFDCCVVCLTDQCGYGQQDVEVMRLGVPADGFSLHGVMALARLVGQRRAGIIHSHGRGAAMYAAGAHLMHRRCRLIHSVHRADGDLVHAHAFVREPILKAMARMVAVSGAAAGAFAKTNDVAEGRIEVIHNGVDVERFRGADELCASNHHSRFTIHSSRHLPTLGAVSNLSHDKDHETILEALRLVRQQRADVRLVVAGDGPLRADVEALICGKGLSEAVDLLGFRYDVPEILAGVDVLLHAPHTEGLGIAVLEAMAADVPVVATAVGGLNEIVADGITGLLVEPENPAAMAGAALKLLGDDTLRATLVGQAIKKVEAEFSLEAMCSRYGDLYEQVLFSPTD